MIILPPARGFRLTGREGTTDEVVVRESWTENVYDINDGSFDDTGTVVDLGANIGAFSTFCAYLGAKKIVCVEPQQANYELLVQNMEKNAVEGCSVFTLQNAVSDYSGTARITDQQGDSQLLQDGTHNASVMTLEALLNVTDTPYADVLKIDIEGSEYCIIENAGDDTLQKFKYITLEFHKTDRDTFGRMVAQLTKHFNIHIIGSFERGGQLYAKRY